jgi:hypothetical protein
LGGVRRRIEALMLPDEPIVELNLDRAVRQETGGSEVVRAGPAMPGRATDRAAPASNLSSKFPPVGRRRHGGLQEVRGDARKNAPPAVLVSATGTTPDRDLVSRGFFLSTSRRNQWALDALGKQPVAHPPRARPVI